jgi:NAD(P)-dependent dehydrogenase (short-subunit alcohol dehydrogenase family)
MKNLLYPFMMHGHPESLHTYADISYSRLDMSATDGGGPGASFDLTGRVALVTGGGRGLGQAIVLALAAAGADVAIAARSAEQVADTARQVRGMGRRSFVHVADLSQVTGAQALAEGAHDICGGIDIVVHAAGTQVRKPAVDIEPADWDGVMQVNVASAFFLSTALMRIQGTRPVSRHIFVTSLTSHIGIANTSAYAASKSAVLGVVRSLAVEWAPLGVTVNAVQPGYFQTQLTEAVFADPVRRTWIESRIPVGRAGEGADLAGAVVFLASGASEYVTGQSLAVDGGWLIA